MLANLLIPAWHAVKHVAPALWWWPPGYSLMCTNWPGRAKLYPPETEKPSGKAELPRGAGQDRCASPAAQVNPLALSIVRLSFCKMQF